jgi:hypothetical protein
MLKKTEKKGKKKKDKKKKSNSSKKYKVRDPSVRNQVFLSLVRGKTFQKNQRERLF